MKKAIIKIAVRTQGRRYKRIEIPALVSENFAVHRSVRFSSPLTQGKTHVVTHLKTGRVVIRDTQSFKRAKALIVALEDAREDWGEMLVKNVSRFATTVRCVRSAV